MKQRQREEGLGVCLRMQPRGRLRIERAELFGGLQPDRFPPLQGRRERRLFVERKGSTQLLAIADVLTTVENAKLVAIDHTDHSDRRLEYVKTLSTTTRATSRRKRRLGKRRRHVEETIGPIRQMLR